MTTSQSLTLTWQNIHVTLPARKRGLLSSMCSGQKTSSDEDQSEKTILRNGTQNSSKQNKQMK